MTLRRTIRRIATHTGKPVILTCTHTPRTGTEIWKAAVTPAGGPTITGLGLTPRHAAQHLENRYHAYLAEQRNTLILNHQHPRTLP